MVAACASSASAKRTRETPSGSALSECSAEKYPLTNTSLKPPKRGNSTPASASTMAPSLAGA